MNQKSITPFHLIAFVLGIIILLYLAIFILGGLVEQPIKADEFTTNYQAIKNWIASGQDPYGYIPAKPATGTAVSSPGLKNVEPSTYFHHPLFAAVIIAPYTVLPLLKARALWIAVNIFMLALGMCMLVLQLKTRISFKALGIFILFGTLNYYSIQAYLTGSLLPFTLMILALTYWLIERRKDQLAGLTLTLGLIQFQAGLILVLIVLFWAGFQKRTRLLQAFWAGLAFELILSTTLLPSWPLGWFRSLLLDIGFTGGYSSLINVLIKLNQVEFSWRVIAIHLALLAVVLVLLVQSHAKATRQQYWASGLAGAIWALILFPASVDNLVLSIPGLILILLIIKQRWNGDMSALFWGLPAFLFVIPWILVIPGMAALQPAVISIMILFYPAAVVIGSVWIRWWIIQPEY